MNDDDENYETVTGIGGRPVRMLKDGRSTRISLTMRDSLSRQHVPKGWITDGSGNDNGLHRPGFRFPVGGTAANDAKQAALRDYEKATVNAWRSPQRVDVESNTTSRAVERRSVAQIARDHQDNMARIYDARDRELGEAWRVGK